RRGPEGGGLPRRGSQAHAAVADLHAHGVHGEVEPSGEIVRLPLSRRAVWRRGRSAERARDQAASEKAAMNIAAQVLEVARRFPERPAITADSATLTYAQLASRAARLGAALRARSGGSGARVVLYLENCPEFF